MAALGRGRRIAAWAAFSALYALACAVSVPPPGGPEDRTPPKAGATSPAADSAGVAPDSEIKITFSESMSRSGVERMVTFSPEIRFGRVRWDGPTLSIEPERPLHPDTTYVVTLAPGYRDAHGVAATAGLTFAFATSARIDSGSVAGTVTFRRVPTKQGVVRCFVLPRDSAFAPEAARPDREAFTDEKGLYRLRYLPTRETRFLVMAYEDKNGNARFDRGTEPFVVYPDTLVLGTARTAAIGVGLDIVDPDEPGRVEGQVANETGVDTVRVSVGLYAGEGARGPRYLVACDAGGAFAFPTVHAGAYGLVAFVDFAPDSVCGSYPCGPDSAATCPEPCVTAADSVRVEPGAVVKLPQLVLRPASTEE